MSPSRYILPFILVILSGLMYVLYIGPQYTETITLRNTKTDYETALKNAGTVRELQAKLLAQVEAIDATDRARLEKLLPPSFDPVLVLYDLNTFAQRHGVALKSPVVTVPNGDPKLGTKQKAGLVNIKFSVSAPYSIFRTFMSDLEKELSIRDIKTLSILGGGEASTLESAVFTYQIEVEGHSYLEKEKVIKKKNDTPSPTPPPAE